MNIVNYLWEWRFVIVLIASAIFFALWQWEKTKTVITGLMLQAKRQAKDYILKSGDEQLEWVVKKAYQFMPVSFRIFLSEERLRKVIHWLYHKGKDYLDDGKMNDSWYNP